MKAQIESSGSNAYLGAVRSGKVQKTKNFVNKQKKEENAEEIKAYLSKLQEIVPDMPKNKKLSKFEVISHVIDYIHDLRDILGLPNCQNEEDEMEDTFMTEECTPTQTTVTVTVINNGNQTNNYSPLSSSRQPLSVISSNPEKDSLLHEVSEQ